MTDELGSDELLDAEYLRVLVLDEFYDAREGLKPGAALSRVLESAREQAKAALSELVTCNPFGGEKVRKLQWEVRRYEDLCRWIEAIVENGETAEGDMTDEDRAETERLLRGETEAKED